MTSKNDDIAHSISLRLNEIMLFLGMRQKDFVDLIKMRQSTFSNYMSGRSAPDAKAFQVFHEAGINIDYLFDKSQTMFNSTPNGIKLATKYDVRVNITPPNWRLNAWIIIFFESVNNFCMKTETNLGKVVELINSNNWLESDYEFVKKFSKFGLNYDWIIGSSNTILSENREGYELANRLKNFKIIEEFKIDVKNIEPKLKSLLKLLNELNKGENSL